MSMKGFAPLWLHIRWGAGRLGPRRKTKTKEEQTSVPL